MVAYREETEIFAMSHKKFAWVMTILYGAPWIWTVVAVIVCGVVLGFAVDPAWGLGCVFIVFLIVPLGMTYLYYSYALCTPTFMNILPHSFSFNDDSVSVRVYYNEKKGDDEDDGDEESERSYGRDLSYDDMGRRYAFPDGMAVKTLRPEPGFLWFPPGIFESLEKFNAAMEALSSGSRGK